MIASPTQLWPQTAYLFLRTKPSLGISEDVFDSIDEHFPFELIRKPKHARFERHLAVLGFGDDQHSWEDGLVIRFDSLATVDTVRQRLAPALAKLDAWAICDSSGTFVENIGDGPMSMFLSKPRGVAAPTDDARRVAQIYLLHDSIDLVRLAADGIRGDLKGTCLPVFHFRDGMVLFYSSKEPARLIQNRCLLKLRNVGDWAIIDSDNFTLTPDGDSDRTWEPIPLRGMSYE